ncbi:MAG: GTP 3',8-cyclase MoaA [Coriobacteriia bacterium]|nr:GTP 3',8-cyclase MoaA [Coriobacteriia bacterium]MBN2840676.1 GTP 3',8-cyclase MoaA [Coriobacteriia bacterium]
MATDTFGRRIDYLRISVTDRCNLRCVYCMPPDGIEWKAHEDILSFEEIERFARIAAGEGISKIRLTGGEPLVRQGIVDHVRRLRETTGIEAIALTTNGTLLSQYAADLAAAGLKRINISLDTLDPDIYTSITRRGRLDDVLEGMEAAFDAGMDPVKLNVVVVRSLDQDLLGFARMTLDRPVHVRFIEYMPVGEVGEHSCASAEADGWSEDDHVPTDEILERIATEGAAAGLGELTPVSRDDAPGGWGPARYYRFPGAPGTLGVIAPLSHHFCGECNRLRLTADGGLRTCLFSDDEIDVRTALRTGTDEDVLELIRQALRAKPEGHNQQHGTVRHMSQIGG